MAEFIPSPHLLVLAVSGNVRLTQAVGHEDYSVWRGNRIVGGGGKALATRIFEKTKGTKVTEIDINKRVDQYIRLRDQIKQKDDAHKDAMAPYREALEKLNGMLLSYLETVGTESAKTISGTVYKTTKKSASLEDADQFMRHVIGTENWDLLERKASQKAVEEFLNENGVLPPGVKFSQSVVVGVRKPT